MNKYTKQKNTSFNLFAQTKKTVLKYLVFFFRNYYSGSAFLLQEVGRQGKGRVWNDKKNEEFLLRVDVNHRCCGTSTDEAN